MLPEGWKNQTVGSVADQQLGKMLSAKNEGKGVPAPYLRNADVQWGRINTDNLPTMWFSEREEVKYKLLLGDVLVCEGGEIGRCAVVSSDLAGIFYQKALHRLRLREGSPIFLAAALEVAARGGRLAVGAASTTIQHLPAERLVRVEVPWPPASEQLRIVAVLEQADRAVGAAARHAADAEVLLKMTIEAAVTPAEHPTGWGDVTLSEVTEKRSGYWGEAAPTAVQGKEVNVVTNAHISRTNQLTGWTTRYFSEAEHNKARLVAGDVAMTGSGEIGKLYRATGELADLCASNFVKVLRPDDRLDAGFLFYWLSSTLARSEMQAHTGGTTLKNLHASFFTDTDVALPPLAEQQAIVARIEKVEAAVRAAQAHLERLRALRSSLLENLVSGRVRLPSTETAGSEVTA